MSIFNNAPINGLAQDGVGWGDPMGNVNFPTLESLS